MPLPNFYLPDENKMTGVATNIVKEILLRIGSNAQIEPLPWARAYKYLLEGVDDNKENIFLYSMARTELRENSFKWVGRLLQ